jgi:demethylmacrocin O-methyltransferase
MLLGPLKFKEIRFAEIGVAGGGSVLLWNKYFQHPSTRLDFFDCDSSFLEHAASFRLTNASFHLMDVSVDGDVERALTLSGPGDYDVILDDSSHNFTHQIRIIKEAFPFIKSGGYMIVEDVFRSIPKEDFERELEGVLALCAEAYFVVCEHANRYSPGWDNDKILVLVKK